MHFKSFPVGKVEGDYDHCPRLAERKFETLQRSLTIVEFQTIETLGQNLPDALPHNSVVVENENS